MNRHTQPLELAELADLLREREGAPRPVTVAGRPCHMRFVAAALAAAVAAGVTVAILTRDGAQKRPSRSRGPATASCAATLDRNGTRYFGMTLHRPAPLGKSLGTGVVPGCGDGGGRTPDQTISVVEINGVPPDQALGVAGNSLTVYVNPAYFTQIPHTPLHDLIFGPGTRLPNERRECQRGHTTTAAVRARVRGVGSGTLTVTLLGDTTLPRQNWIFPDARTVFAGIGADTRVEPGDVVSGTVLVCRHARDPHFLKLVATRLALDG